MTAHYNLPRRQSPLKSAVFAHILSSFAHFPWFRFPSKLFGEGFLSALINGAARAWRKGVLIVPFISRCLYTLLLVLHKIPLLTRDRSKKMRKVYRRGTREVFAGGCDPNIFIESGRTTDCSE